jgi:AcrR family transcriptional regulator
VGVDAVIAESGGAKATLYKHFRRKDDLILAYLDKDDRAWRAQLEAASEAAASSRGSRRRDTARVDEPDLMTVHLDVYDTRDGPWNPEHGDLEIPEDWEFLPAGYAFVTRQVKAAGPYWTAWKPRSRNRPHRRRLGLWAPSEAVTAARRAAAETEQARLQSRRSGARQRERREDRYREQLRSAIVTYLDFADDQVRLAEEIADEAVGRAAEVGSGRIGRAGTLTLAEKAELAARAHIRHRFTDYHVALDTLPIDELSADYDSGYRNARAIAHAAVDEILSTHRRETEAPLEVPLRESDVRRAPVGDTSDPATRPPASADGLAAEQP